MSARKLLLVDDRVSADVLLGARKEDVDYILFSFGSDFATLQEAISAKLSEMDAVYTDIALVQHGHPEPFYQIVGNSGVANIEDVAPYSSFDEIKSFLTFLYDKGARRFDFLACALYSHVNMQHIFAHLEAETGMDLRASVNFTGEYPNGDWIMESDNVDIRDNYFTEAISDFREILYVFDRQYGRTENQYYTVVSTSPSNSGAFAILVKPTGKIYTFTASTSNMLGHVGSSTGMGVVKDLSNVDISNFVNIYSAHSAIAGVTSDGKVWAWGDTNFGGLGSTNVLAGLLKDASGNDVTGITTIYSTYGAFAAVKGSLGPGSIVYAWGDSTVGSLHTTTNTKVAGTRSVLTGTTAIFTTNSAFAAIVGSGSTSKVYCWGSTTSGHLGSTTNVPSTHVSLDGVHSIYSTFGAFAAIKGTGASSQVLTWGSTTRGHIGSTATTPMPNALLNGTTNIFSNESCFAAIVGSGSTAKIYSWGAASSGTLNSVSANVPDTHPSLDGVEHVYNTNLAFAVIKGTGASSQVYTWGSTSSGHLGSTATLPETHVSLNGTTKIAGHNLGVFAAVVSSNNTTDVWTWGAVSGTNFSTVAQTPSKRSSGDLIGSTDVFVTGQYAFGAYNNDRIWAWGTGPNFTILSSISKLSFPVSLSVPPSISASRATVVLQGPKLYMYGDNFPTEVNLLDSGLTEKVRYSSITARGGNIILTKPNGNGLYFYNSIPYVAGSPIDPSIVISKTIETTKAVALLTTNGRVIWWGSDGATAYTYATRVTLTFNSAVVTNVVDIFATSHAFAALTSTGSVYVWGDTNVSGYAGISPQLICYPSTTTPITNITQIIPNESVFAFIEGSGSTSKVYSWGNTQLGGLSSNAIPTVVGTNTDLSGTISIYATKTAFAALKFNGTAYTWGDNATGGFFSSIPATHASLTGITAIYATGSAFAFIKGSGPSSSVYTLGNNGCINVTTTGTNSLRTSAELNGINTLYAGEYCFVAIVNGVAYSWGAVGRGALSSTKNKFETHALLTDIKDVFFNSGAIVARKTDNSLVTWGLTTSGGVGTSSTVPATHSALTNVTNVYMTSNAMIVRRSDGSHWQLGQMDNGGTLSSTTPTRINDLNINYIYPVINKPNLGLYSLAFYVENYTGELYTIGNQFFGMSSISLPPKIPKSILVPLVIPTVSWAPDTLKRLGDAPFGLSQPTSDSTSAFVYTCDNLSVATVSGNTVTIVGVGTAIITATQPLIDTYDIGSAFFTLTVRKAEPTISWMSNTTKTFGDAAFALAAPTSNSSGAFTYSSSNTAVATVSGSTVTLVSPGSATITASQASTADYDIGTATFALTVNKITPVISWMSSTTKTVGDAAFTLTTPTSTSAGAFTYSSSNTAVATVSGSSVTIVGAGSATITASQASTANYDVGTATFALTVNKAAPSITWVSNTTKTVGDAAFELTTPTSTSAGAFTYSSSNTAVATMSGSTVTIVGAGTATITASQASTVDYDVGTATFALTVSKVAPSITWMSDAAKTFGDAAFALTAPTSNSAGAFTYSSSNAAVATVSGSTVTIVGAGSATITASQASTANYDVGTATFVLTVANAAPTISWMSDVAKTFGDAAFELDAPSSTSLGAFTYSSSNTAIATVSGSTLTIVGAGTATITASQAAASPYNSGTATFILTVAKAIPTITWMGDLTKSVGNAAVTLDAPTSSSSGAFTYSSSSSSVASISGTTLTFFAEGSATITASQAADANYLAASASFTVTVTANNSGTSLTWISNLNKVYGDAAFPLTAPTSDSNGAFTYSSSDTSIATVDGTTVSIVGVGEVTLSAQQAATASYDAATATVKLTVVKGTPTLSWSASLSKVATESSFTVVSPTSISTGAFTYSSSNTGVATINASSGTVQFVAPGETVLTAVQAATALYNQVSATATLTYSRVAQAVIGFGDRTLRINEIDTFTPTFLGGVTASYSLLQPGIASLVQASNGTSVILTGLTHGTVTLRATTPETAVYSAGSFDMTVTVRKKTNTINTSTSLNSEIFYVGNRYDVVPVSVSTTAFTFASANSSKASVNAGGRVTFLQSGPVNVLVNQAANDIHEEGVAAIEFQPRPAITSPQGVADELAAGHPMRAIDSYQVYSGLPTKEVVARVKATGITMQPAQYNQLTELLRDFVFETVPDVDFRVISGAKVLTYSSSVERNVQLNSMIVKSSNIPSNPIDVVYPVVTQSGEKIIDVSSLTNMIRFDMLDAEEITIKMGDFQKAVIFHQSSTDPYVTVDGTRYNVDDSFYIGNKLLRVIAFGGLTLYSAFQPIRIQIPLEINAGSFDTAMTVQGERVAYNKVQLPLKYQTAPADPSSEDMAATFQWMEDPLDQTQVLTQINPAAVGSFVNGKAVLKALFQAALDGTSLKNIGLSGEGIVYADTTVPRNTITDPVKYYVDKDTHVAGVETGSTLKSYLEEYLYDNLSATIGLAATTGQLNINMNRVSNGTVKSASEVIAEALASQMSDTDATQSVASISIRQNIYEQMFTLAPERFMDGGLMRREPAANGSFQNMPFQPGDTLAFLATFKFPASSISAFSAVNVLRTGNLIVPLGNRVSVTTPAQNVSNSNLSDFPEATVLMRVELTV